MSALFWPSSPRLCRSSSGLSGEARLGATTPPTKKKNAMKKFPVKLFAMTKLLPIAALMMTCSGCAHYKAISSDRIVRRIKADETFHAPVDGWFVPDARWQEIREAIADRIEQLQSSGANATSIK
jgi:hypothetical protein